MNNQRPKIIIFTGDGKGKTTSALGLAVAAALAKRKSAVVQFLKGGGFTGELFAAEFLAPYFSIRQFGYGCPIAEEIKTGRKKCNKCGVCFRENRNSANAFAEKALQYARKLIVTGSIDLLVLDEVSHAMRHKLIPEETLLEFLSLGLPRMEIILTGRNMPEAILNAADQVTVCQVVKHPMMTRGIDARRGIEY